LPTFPLFLISFISFLTRASVVCNGCPPSQQEIPGISTRQLHPDGCTSVIVADAQV
jgi:hypothetical protein